MQQRAEFRIEGDIVKEDIETQITEIMKNYSQKVYLLAYSFVKNQQTAEDITQEVFIKCYKYIKNFRGDASIKTWIYRITVNTAKDHMKKSNKLLDFTKYLYEKTMKTEAAEETLLKHIKNEELLQKDSLSHMAITQMVLL